MKELSAINLGYNDATNYRKSKKNKEMFTKIFVADDNLNRLMDEDVYFLIGDKGTGKTAYAAYLENKEYKNTISKIIDLESTEYKVFLNLYKLKLLQLADFTRVWKIILLMLVANDIEKKEIESFGPKRSAQLLKLKENIDDYYDHAFIPEISNTFRYIFDRAEIDDLGINLNMLGLGTSAGLQTIEKFKEEQTIHKFQNNLMDLERKFIESFQRLKIKKNRFLFIDNVDVRIEECSNEEYQLCVRGLANAIWEINSNIFRAMPESTGFLKLVLCIRTDMFSDLNLHNQANKIRDNSIVLDWRTTYENYRTSPLFIMCNRLLSHENPGLPENEYWDYYFPWKIETAAGRNDDSFINCMRPSLSRPRDLISIMKAIQKRNKKESRNAFSTVEDFTANETQNEISNYYIDEAKDWCLYKFSNDEFNTLLFFFQFLEGKSRFTYDEFKHFYNEYIQQVNDRSMVKFAELKNYDDFLQLLYDLNMICYYDKGRYGEDLFRFCYREREIYNLSPKVKTDSTYGIHFALLKALNLGKHSKYDAVYQ